MNLWGGRFYKSINKKFKSFNNSLIVDYRLVYQDIWGSIAWSRALLTVNVLTKKEQELIENSLNILLINVKNNKTFLINSDDEDIHSWVEKKLILHIGNIAKKLHTGRSRNDQIATDIKLWCKKKILKLIRIIEKLQKILVDSATCYKHVIMPGYTHLQRAQPITFAHWYLAYNQMFLRDKIRLQNSLKIINFCPLGSGALSGTPYDLNRDRLAKWLGFYTATNNSLDSVSDRDHVFEFLFNASISMVHLSRFSEDLIFFNTEETGFIELPDCITSGSSIMPQKKNPDILELIRGKCGKIFGALTSLIITFKGLPLSYNKDMQEDKEILFNTIDTWTHCLNMAILVISKIKINKNKCKESALQSYANATELADYLVNNGIPFREAHYIVGKIILEAINNNISLEQFSLEQFHKFSTRIKNDVYNILTLDSCLNKRISKGGVSNYQIEQSINKAQKELIKNDY